MYVPVRKMWWIVTVDEIIKNIKVPKKISESKFNIYQFL